MACEALETKCGKAVLTCNTTDIAFGPIFRHIEDARQFIKTSTRDPRLMSDDELAENYHLFYYKKQL